MLSNAMIFLALVYLGAEPKEGIDPGQQLDSLLADYELTRDQFLTPESCFTIGYHRGSVGMPFGDEQVPQKDGKPVAELEGAIEGGYALGLEARELRLAPPPSLVYAAWKDGQIKPGEFDKWAATVDLKSAGNRLAVAVTVGSGKDARVIPAGTPVDVICDIEKDGVDHVVVTYDGLPLIIPNPSDSPRVVSADTAVAVASTKTKRATKTKESGDTAKTPRAPVERGPTLRDAIIHVIEGADGGPGPFQSNGKFASRVRARCVELGIGDKANTFMEKADRHVPYYLNIYKPEIDDAGTATGAGRLGVDEPKLAIVLKVEARKYFLRGEGLSDEARFAQIPEELRKKIEAAGDAIITVPKAAPAA